MSELVIKLIQWYQRVLRVVINQVLLSIFGWTSPCRFPETCSEYTLRQVRERGTILGLWAGSKRIVRCWSLPH